MIDTDYCTECGHEAISSCQNCEKSIIPHAITGTEPPSYCGNCGEPFPWTHVEPLEKIDLAEALQIGESEQVEFKRELPSNVRDVTKELVALANHQGGTLILGVENDGNVIGLEDIHEIEERVFGSINSNIDPPLRVQVEKLEHEESDLLQLHVPQADDKPFGIGGKFYIRSGTTVESLRSEDLANWFK